MGNEVEEGNSSTPQIAFWSINSLQHFRSHVGVGSNLLSVFQFLSSDLFGQAEIDQADVQCIRRMLTDPISEQNVVEFDVSMDDVEGVYVG